MGKLFILFVVMPIAEIAVLINVGEIIGGWNTVLLVILSAMLGAILVKREGVATLAQAQLKMQKGELPAKELGSGLLLLVAGVLLVTPGFITDIFGLLLTLPFTRNRIGEVLFTALNGKIHMSGNMGAGGFGAGGFGHGDSNQSAFGQDDDIIDGEYQDKTASSNQSTAADTSLEDKR
ncbi:MAG: FxsA family protein [Glaciecola sp.]|uniref:FxsA family protein n=1 Tax=Glaciecola sp. HTCC2999 TaxID=455436 RepID=UPI0000E0EE8E|nr:FxsA family protein [Glaciecola sp. HTCC2999]